ncbi:MAG: polyisoprenoid-binding protein, partial [Lutibacter sp.]
GTIAISKGKLDLSGDDLVGGKFIIDMNSIVNLDMPADNEYNAKLVGHLKAADFFDVEKFPTATFEITNVVKNEGKVAVTGNLTAKEITKSITIPATFAVANGFVTFKSDTFKIDRTVFGIEYKSTKLADVLKEKSIDDLFEMSFDVMAKK